MLVSVSELYCFAPHCRVDSLQVPCPSSPLASKHSSAEVPWSAVGELSLHSNLLCQCQRGEEQPCLWSEVGEGRGMHRHLCVKRSFRQQGRAQARAPVTASGQVIELGSAPVAARLHISSAQLMRCNSSYLCSH